MSLRAWVAGVLCGGAALFAAPVHAVVSSAFSGGVLTITTNAADTVTVTCNAGNVDIGGAAPGTGPVACAAVTRIAVNCGGFADVVNFSGVTGANFTALSGTTLAGGLGNDVFFGSALADAVTGGDGNDTALLGGGDDSFTWSPGDDDDVIEGQTGSDSLIFNGANVMENYAISPNGGRVILSRDVAAVVMDLNDVETLVLNPLGGIDNITLNDLSGTDLTLASLNLLVGTAGDGAADSVFVTGTAAADVTTAGSVPGGLVLGGFATTVRVTGADASGDTVTVNLLAGNDRFTFPFNLDDAAQVVMNGGADNDIATLSGTAASDTIAITANGAQVAISNPTRVLMQTSVVESLVVNADDGADTITATGNVAALIAITMDGGEGADQLFGGNGADIILGGAGNDSIDGQQGNDTVLMGEGDDTFTWDPGDGSDVVEGQANSDTLVFNGSAGDEQFAASPNGGRVLFTRNLGNIVMDLNDTETLRVNAFGGVDTVTVNDLAGTDVTLLSANLQAFGGGGDGGLDNVVINGTTAADTTAAGSAPGGVAISGLVPIVEVIGNEVANDVVTLNLLQGNDTFDFPSALAGATPVLVVGGGDVDTTTVNGTNGDDVIALTANGAFAALTSGAAVQMQVSTVENLVILMGDGSDSISAVGNLAPLTSITVDGGPGADTILGGNGSDTLLGGSGDDFIDGQQGNDVAFLGADNDTFQWDPGDGSDIVEGQAGSDTLRFNGSAGNEIFAAAANGGRVLFTRNLGNIVMDLDDVERIEIQALNGMDAVTVNNVAGTDLTSMRIDLTGTIGGVVPDSAADTVNIVGSNAADMLSLDVVAGVATASRAGFSVAVAHPDFLADRITLQGLAGDDRLSVTTAVLGLTQIALDGDSDSGVVGAGDLAVVIGEGVDETWQVVDAGAGSVNLNRSAPSLRSAVASEIERVQLDTAAGIDNVSTQLLTTVGQILDGGAPSTFPGDVLSVAGFAGNVSLSPITAPGFRPIVHSNFEFEPNGGFFEGFLTGVQETPPNASPARGYGTVTLNSAGTAIDVALQFSSLTGMNTLTHIHGPAPRGVAAAPIIDLPASNAATGSISVQNVAVTPTQVQQLRAGLLYFNVHSSAPGFADGEIRGQIDNVMFRDGFE